MYSLYDLFRNKEEIIRSIGTEYGGLDYNSLILILINNCKFYNLLDNDSINIVNNPIFYQLLFSVEYSEKYKDLYFLDVILLSINNEYSRNLIHKYGTNKAKDNISNSIFPKDILLKILLEQTDLDAIINLHNTNSYYFNLLNDSNILYTLMLNIISKLKPLPGLNPNKYYGPENDSRPLELQYRYGKDVYVKPIPIAEYLDKGKPNTLNFNTFNKWYTRNYYTKHCDKYNNFILCYSGARDNNDTTNTSKYLKSIVNNIRIVNNENYRRQFEGSNYIRPLHLLEIFESIKDVSKQNQKFNLTFGVPSFDDHCCYEQNRDEILLEIIVNSLNTSLSYNELTEDDINAYIKLILFIKNNNDIWDDNLTNIIRSSVEDKRLFKILYLDILDDSERGELDAVQDDMREIDTMNGSSYITYHKFIKALEYINLDVKQIINNNWKEFIYWYVVVGHSDNMMDETEYFNDLEEVLNLSSKYCEKEEIKDVLTNALNNMYEFFDYTHMKKFVKEYITTLD